MKAKSEYWTVRCFRDTVSIQYVFPFLKDGENVIDPDIVIFVLDKAPCMRANMTQHLIQDNNFQFSGNDN